MAYLTTAISAEFPPEFIDLGQVGCSHLVMVLCEFGEMPVGVPVTLTRSKITYCCADTANLLR